MCETAPSLLPPDHTPHLRATEPASAHQLLKRCEADGGCWLFRCGYRDMVLGPDAPDWFYIERNRHAELIKTGRDRTIHRVDLCANVVYVKAAGANGWIERIKLRLGRHALQREWNSALEAETRGVPAVRCLALGLGPHEARRIVLLSEGQLRFEPLTQALLRSGPGRLRNKDLGALRDAVADLLARSHDRGFCHADAHPANILVDTTPNADRRAMFLDVLNARFYPGPLSVERSLRSLAQLDQRLSRHLTRSQRLRFFREYRNRRESLRHVRPGSVEERGLLAHFARIRRLHQARLARHRDRRLLREGKYFATPDLPRGWRAYVVTTLERRHVFPEADVPDRSREDWHRLLGDVLAGRHTQRTAQIAARARTPSYVDADPREADLRMEVDSIPAGLPRILAAIRGTPQRRRFLESHRLRHRDVPAPLMLAYCERRRFGFPVETRLILAEPDIAGICG